MLEVFLETIQKLVHGLGPDNFITMKACDKKQSG